METGASKITIILVIAISFVVSVGLLIFLGRLLLDKTRGFHKNWVVAARELGARVEKPEGIIYRRVIGINGKLEGHTFHLQQRSLRYGYRVLLEVSIINHVDFSVKKRTFGKNKRLSMYGKVLEAYNVSPEYWERSPEVLFTLKEILKTFPDTSIRCSDNKLVFEKSGLMKNPGKIVRFVTMAIRLAEKVER